MKKLFLFFISFFLLFSTKTNSDIFRQYAQAISCAAVLAKLHTLAFNITVDEFRNTLSAAESAGLMTLLYNKMESLELEGKAHLSKRCKSSCS